MGEESTVPVPDNTLFLTPVSGGVRVCIIFVCDSNGLCNILFFVGEDALLGFKELSGTRGVWVCVVASIAITNLFSRVRY